MTQIRNAFGEKKILKIRDTSRRRNPLDAETVATAFNATASGSTKGLDLFEVREEMTRLLRSSGGRPSLAGTASQVKIPKIEADWVKLSQLVLASADLPHKPSAGQMAAMVLHLALDRLPLEELEKAIRKEFS